MFSLHFTTALLEQVNKRPKEDLKSKHFQEFWRCQVLTKLVTLDHFRNAPWSWSHWAQGGTPSLMLGERHLAHSSGAQFYSIPAWTLGRSCPKPPDRNCQSLAPGEACSPSRGVLLAAEGACLPCASVLTVLSQKHSQLVWPEPQAYLLGKAVRFKEHTIPIRVFFKWPLFGGQMKAIWLSPGWCVSYPGSHSSTAVSAHIISSEMKQFCLLLALQDEDRNTIQALWKPPNFIHYEGQIVTEGLTFPCHFILNIILMLLKTCIIAEV